MEDDINNIANIAAQTISTLGRSGAANLLGPLGAIAGAVRISKNGIGVQSDVRIIKASTGEVVWQKRITGKDMTTQVGVGFVKVGSLKLNNEMYFKAVDDAATKIAKELAAEIDAGKLFVK